MAKRFAIRQIIKLMCVSGIFSLTTTNAFATAFQLWEQDGASVGNYHAGRAAYANDASIAYYNPAGILHMPTQQLVIGDVAVVSDIRFSGTVSVFNNVIGLGPIPVGAPFSAVGQGGSFSQIPDIHYVAPINQYVGVGLSIVAPFGLRTDYGRTSAVSFAANLSQLQVVDLTPSVGFRIYKGLSGGVGLDVERMSAELSQVAYAGTGSNTDAYAKGWSTAYGYHVGLMYELLPTTRFGLTYNSQVVHHMTGYSRIVGPIADLANGGPIEARSNVPVTLPPFTTFSAFHQFNDRFALMGTVIYTQWSVFKNLSVRNSAAVVSSFTPPFFFSITPTTTATINVPQYYRNSWNFSVGGDFYANDKITLRAGLGYDQSPVKDFYRDLRVPDNDRVAVALGAHYQPTRSLGFDVGWTHLFMVGTTNINPPPAVTGSEIVATNGSIKASADVFGGQFSWSFA